MCVQRRALAELRSGALTGVWPKPRSVHRTLAFATPIPLPPCCNHLLAFGRDVFQASEVPRPCAGLQIKRT